MDVQILREYAQDDAVYASNKYGGARTLQWPTAPDSILHIGVDVGGTFTDLVAWDGTALRIVKIPSTPPAFHEAVIDAVNRIARMM